MDLKYVFARQQVEQVRRQQMTKMPSWLKQQRDSYRGRMAAVAQRCCEETGMWRPEPLKDFPWRDDLPSIGFKIISRVCGYVGSVPVKSSSRTRPCQRRGPSSGWA